MRSRKKNDIGGCRLRGREKVFLRAEISCCFGGTHIRNCLVIHRLFTPRLGRYRGEGTGRFGRERRETTFELTNGQILNTQIVLVNPAAEVDVARPKLVFASSEFSCRMSLLNLPLVENREPSGQQSIHPHILENSESSNSHHRQLHNQAAHLLFSILLPYVLMFVQLLERIIHILVAIKIIENQLRGS